MFLRKVLKLINSLKKGFIETILPVKISGIQFNKYFISKHNLLILYYKVNCNK